ncbi:MAG TPA: ABC transporter permease [Bryobacteraceae bacterium]|nr:ABC transporter permease [Bryobacteraceae bacterium]
MATLRIIVRGLARTPGFTLIAIGSLALGIGANTAIFSLLDQLLLRKLPVKNPSELVFMYSPGPTQGHYSSDESGHPSFSYPVFRELQKEQTPFTGIAGARRASASLSYNNSATPGSIDTVSGNYFEVLGVRPAMGRLLSEDDDRAPGERAVAVLSYGYWLSRFGAAPSVLNQKLIVNGYPFTIIGVAQKDFTGEMPGESPDVFVPITMRKELVPGWDAFANRKDYWVTMFARLKPGVSREQAETAINIPYHAQVEIDAQLLSRPRPEMLAQFRAKKIILKPGEYGRGDLRDNAREPTLLLMGMTLLVLLICCANVANLQLVRAASRAREIAVRLALGASRGQLIRHLLAESSLLAIGGGALGLGAAWAAMRAILAALPPGSNFSSVLSSTLDLRALLFCLAVSILTGFLFGLFPALQSTRPDLNTSLKDQSGQSTASGSSNAFRKTLVTAQVAVSLLLLISAGLLSRTLLNLRNIDLGFRADHLVMFGLDPRLNRYNDQAAYAFYDQLTDRLASIPGVQLVSAGMNPPVSGNDDSQNITVPGYIPPTDDAADSNYDQVGADYFRTMGIPLIAGRDFTLADNASAPKVAIVNEEFARHFFPGQNPLGHRFARGGAKQAADIEIVGVVKESKYSGIKESPQRVFYVPYRQAKIQHLYFYLRTAIDPRQIESAIRAGVASLDPNMPIRSIKTMDDQIDQDLFAERILSALTAIFAALATVLAALGLYGVLAYNIARRTREIGIRMALGADAGRVRALVIREVAVMVLIGTVAGVAASAAAGSLLQPVLYGLKAWDLPIYFASAAVLWLIALAAAYIPSRRATAVDPLVALRYE